MSADRFSFELKNGSLSRCRYCLLLNCKMKISSKHIYIIFTFDDRDREKDFEFISSIKQMGKSGTNLNKY